MVPPPYLYNTCIVLLLFFHTQYSSGSLNVMYFLWPLCFSYIWVWLVYIYIMTKDVPSPLANRKTYLCTIVRIMSCPDVLNTQTELLKWLMLFLIHIFCIFSSAKSDIWCSLHLSTDRGIKFHNMPSWKSKQNNLDEKKNVQFLIEWCWEIDETCMKDIF